MSSLTVLEIGRSPGKSFRSRERNQFHVNQQSSAEPTTLHSGTACAHCLHTLEQPAPTVCTLWNSLHPLAAYSGTDCTHCLPTLEQPALTACTLWKSLHPLSAHSGTANSDRTPWSPNLRLSLPIIRQKYFFREVPNTASSPLWILHRTVFENSSTPTKRGLRCDLK